MNFDYVVCIDLHCVESKDNNRRCDDNDDEGGDKGVTDRNASETMHELYPKAKDEEGQQKEARGRRTGQVPTRTSQLLVRGKGKGSLELIGALLAGMPCESPAQVFAADLVLVVRCLVVEAALASACVRLRGSDDRCVRRRC